jgi:pimeloyl-ACP methyl ester carboxylesterase
LSAVVLILAVGAGGAAERPGRYEGVLGGARYLIDVPADWNGGLVMFAHGYEGEGPGSGTVRGEPLAEHLTRRGYAWAASGYRAWGYRPDWFLRDLLALKAHFTDMFGAPRWAIVHGQSMGGHVAIASMELHPDTYEGALLECGVIDGVGLVDWLRAYTAAAQYFSGLPLLDTPRPEFDRMVSGPWLAAMGEPGHYTEAGKRFDSVGKHLAGGDVPLRLEGLALRYVQDLSPRDPGPARAREFARHADTRYIEYDIDPGLGADAETLNRDMPRFVPDPGARSYDVNPAFAELTGKIRAPVMSIHETADFRVPFRLEQDYRRRVQKAGADLLLVQRAARWPGHCGIAGAVRERAFDDLVSWIEQGTKPDGDDVLGEVTQLGLKWTPLLHPKDPAPR